MATLQLKNAATIHPRMHSVPPPWLHYSVADMAPDHSQIAAFTRLCLRGLMSGTVRADRVAQMTARDTEFFGLRRAPWTAVVGAQTRPDEPQSQRTRLEVHET